MIGSNQGITRALWHDLGLTKQVIYSFSERTREKFRENPSVCRIIIASAAWDIGPAEHLDEHLEGQLEGSCCLEQSFVIPAGTLPRRLRKRRSPRFGKHF